MKDVTIDYPLSYKFDLLEGYMGNLPLKLNPIIFSHGHGASANMYIK